MSEELLIVVMLVMVFGGLPAALAWMVWRSRRYYDEKFTFLKRTEGRSDPTIAEPIIIYSTRHMQKDMLKWFGRIFVPACIIALIGTILRTWLGLRELFVMMQVAPMFTTVPFIVLSIPLNSSVSYRFLHVEANEKGMTIRYGDESISFYSNEVTDITRSKDVKKSEQITHITLRDGTVIRLYLSTVLLTEPVSGILSVWVADNQYDEAAKHLRHGQPIKFGPVTLTRETITFPSTLFNKGGKTVAWADVTSINAVNRQCHLLDKGGNNLGGFAFAQVPNGFLILRLIHDELGIPYTDEQPSAL